MKKLFIFTIFLVLYPITLKCQITVFQYPSPLLYKYCNNPVILSEVCNRQLDIDYVFEGGKIEISDSNRLHIRLFPVEDSCFLTIFEKKKTFNQFLMRMKCRVIEAPTPYIDVTLKNGIATRIKDTVNLKAGDTLLIDVMPDPEFALYFQDEIQYKPEKIVFEYLHESKDIRQKPQKQEIANITNKWNNNQVAWVAPVNYSHKNFTLCINNLHRTDSKGHSRLVQEEPYFEHSRKIFVQIK